METTSAVKIFEKQLRKQFCCRVLLQTRLNRTREAWHPVQSRERSGIRDGEWGCELLAWIFSIYHEAPSPKLHDLKTCLCLIRLPVASRSVW